MGRQIVLSYSEIRIANAFKSGIALSDEDIVEMQRRVVFENSEWTRRKNKIENVGEIIEDKPKRDQRKRRDKLKPSWGAPIPAGSAIWD